MQGSLVWGQIGYYALQERNVTSEIVSGLDAKWSHVQYNLHMYTVNVKIWHVACSIE